MRLDGAVMPSEPSEPSELSEWDGASCRQPGAPSPFPDDWGIGRRGVAIHSRALALCRGCPVRILCGQRALEEYESHREVYGVRCGIAFTDVERVRQALKIECLRAILERER